MTDHQILSELPLHPVPPDLRPHPLRIDGLPAGALEYSAPDLARLPQTTHAEDFNCEAGWRVPDQVWRGVLVADLLDATGVTIDSAPWVEFASGDFRFSLPTIEARRALVALALNDAPLNREHGGPCRLLVPGGACFTSIKWLDCIELRQEPGPDRAAEIARQRNANS